VKAILFRVDSPGGSYVASDTIWREVVRARQAGKPVIVSMGNLAGSGGIFVPWRPTKSSPSRDHHGFDRSAWREDADQRAVGQSWTLLG